MYFISSTSLSCLITNIGRVLQYIIADINNTSISVINAQSINSDILGS